MQLGVCAQVLYAMPFETALDTAAAEGFAAIELPVDSSNPFIDLDAALDGGADALLSALDRRGLRCSALSNHQEGQLLLGPHGEDTDVIWPGSAEAKAARAADRLVRSAELARRMGVTTVIAFTGCREWARWFPWPLADGWERMQGEFRDRLRPILDEYACRGVRLALECHPKQFAYNLETARLAWELVDRHDALAFNLDPANLLLAGMDPVVFAAELGSRVAHVHAKDGERVQHHVERSGLLAHGPWDRPGRGFRFRIPGWGDVPWRRLITELHLAGFDGVLSVEHEDPTMGRLEGLRQARRYLEPLLLHDRQEARWW
ncbi:MAG: sugar phosphate isomerase/epimerase [Deltaproteobacteria bacterium]|nr:sugar phosphate isomerase/epimerase [Deltaproteobacteria bacterium]